MQRVNCLVLLECGANLAVPRNHLHQQQRRCHHHRPTILPRSGLHDEVSQLNRGKSPVEELSGETNTMVTDVMDIDRTPELLAWIFSGIFKGRADQPDPPSSTTSSSSPSPLSPPPVAAALRSGAEAGSALSIISILDNDDFANQRPR
ncbi:hypothetical protein Vafri_6474 [Volvox africanus]|uniref:Uncharacterized protein n=1 Tax=Volvox africanus TaxID=51714 RepID=A0A8J4AY73_9CHLO|nr:hypothetical protein Vafri_6474 [Volvox africanus]